jgi:hypothetical protein
MDNLCFLVLSCDKYKMFWSVFFDRFEKYYPDNVSNIYLLSNKEEFAHEKVKTIKTVEDFDWSTNVLIALDKIPEKYVLLMLEDIPLCQPVNSKRLRNIYEEFSKSSGKYLNLKSSPKPKTGKNTNSYFGELPNNVSYRAALVPAIWRKDELYELLVHGETAWQFEIRASKSISDRCGYYSCEQRELNFHHLMIKGRITLTAYLRYLDKTERKKLCLPVNNILQETILYIAYIRSKTLRYLLPKWLLFWMRTKIYKS